MKIFLSLLFSSLISITSFAVTIEAPDTCHDIVRDEISKMFEAQFNRHYSVEINKIGKAGVEYGDRHEIVVYSAVLNEESGANLYIVLTKQYCTIEEIIEFLNSDNF